MFITAVLCADAEGFATWCRAQGYTGVGDGAESHSGKWLAVRIMRPEDLAGVEVHRVDYAPGFWRGDRAATDALNTLAVAAVRQLRDEGPGSPAAPHSRGPS